MRKIIEMVNVKTWFCIELRYAAILNAIIGFVGWIEVFVIIISLKIPFPAFFDQLKSIESDSDQLTTRLLDVNEPIGMQTMPNV